MDGIIIEGSVKRESLVAAGVVNLRHFVLAASGRIGAPNLCSYRNKGDGSPSKIWTLSRNTSISNVGLRTFSVRRAGQSTLAVLTAQVRGKGRETENLYCITITFDNIFFPLSGDKLTLCFEEEDTAQLWRSKLLERIEKLQQQPEIAGNGGGQTKDRTPSIEAATPIVSGADASAAINDNRFPERASVELATAHSNASLDVATTSGTRSWNSVQNINGVSVYSEEEGPDGEGGAVMASVVVRGTPKACCQALLRGQASSVTSMTPDTVGGTFTDAVSILQTIDSHTHIIRHVWESEGPFGRRFLAAREMVALRTWRREPDGTYIVLYQSTSHRDAKERRKPVRAHVKAAGFTLSPLLPQYIKDNGPSQECLVTFVIKADLGGAVAPLSVFPRLAAPLVESARWALLEPLLMSVVALRDRVEQSRFVVIPYAMTAASAKAGAATQEVKTPALPLEEPVIVAEPLQILGEDGKERIFSGEALLRENGDGFEDAIDIHGGAPLGQDENGLKVLSHAVPSEFAWAMRGTTQKRFWSDPGTCNLKLRGPNYLRDRLKIPALLPVLDLYTSDLVDSDEPLWKIGESLPSLKACNAPFAFILNLIYPANGMLQSLVTTWTAPVDVFAESEEALVGRWGDDEGGTIRAFFRNLKPWMEGDGPDADKRRNLKFKLIPRVAEGSWVVRQSVGTTPVLLGQKLTTKYFRGKTPNGCAYFEVDVDITSNTVANSVTRLVVNSITSLVVELAPLVEGQAEEELPERLLGSVRYDHLNLRTACVWDEGRGGLARRGV